MTIALSANTPRVSYTVSQGATQTSFAVPFVFFTGSTDLNVFVDNTERTFDASTSNTSLYTVSGGSGSTGTVTTSVTGATGGSTVVITRAIPLSRTTDFPSSGAFEISKLNTELDTVTAIQSDFNDSASRAIRLQDSDSAVSMELPLLASRKGTVLGFNATTGAAEAGPTITAVQSLADVTASINLLGTSAVVTDMGLLATSANITAMGILGTSANVTAMGLLGTSDVVADMALLGTSDVVADMALLANTDVIADMNTLATSDIISDLNTLATSDIVTDMNLLATSDNVTAMGVLGTSANVTAMGLLGTSAVVEDMGFLGTSANVTAMGLLGTSANVTAMGLLGTSAVVTDMSLLGTSAVVTDMDILATSANVTNMATLGASGVVGNIATVAGISSNVTTVANNVTGVNSFAERYRVASSAPSTSLDVGDLYFDTTANELKVYKSSGWAAAGSTVNGTSERFTYNITGTPTTLTGASGTGFAEASGSTLAYDAGFIDVYLNGVKMVNGTDVTVTSGTSVVFASALSNGDVVDIVTFGTFNVASINADNISSGTVPVARVSGSYTNITGTGALDAGSITSGFGNIDIGSSTITTTGAISGGTLTGTLQTASQTNITSVGTLSGLAVSGATTITTADNTAQLELVSTDADSGIGPHQVFYRNSASPADDDLLCELDFRGRNDNSQDVDYATINVKATDVSDGTEDGQFILQTKQAGSTVDRMNLSSSETVFNEDSKDIDFRVESDGNTHALFVQAGSGGVGIGESSPNSYHANADDLVVSGSGSGSVGITIRAESGHQSTLAFADGTTGDTPIQGRILYNHNGDSMNFYTNGANERMRITSSGDVGIGVTAPASKLQVNTANMGNLDAVCLKNETNNVGGYFIRFRRSSNAEIGSIEQTGGGATVSYNTSSDYRLKENVDYTFDATTRLKQLKPARFNFIGDTATVDGFLAHEVSDIVPHAISGKKDAMTKEVLYVNGDEIPEGKKVGDVKYESQIAPQGIDHSKLVPLLVKTIQELEARITALESA